MIRFLHEKERILGGPWLIANAIGWGLAFGIFGGAIGLVSYLSLSLSSQSNSSLQIGLALLISPVMGLCIGITQGSVLKSKVLSPKPWVLAYSLGFAIGGLVTFIFYFYLDSFLNKLTGFEELFAGLLIGWCVMLLTQWAVLRKSTYPLLQSLVINIANTGVTCISATIIMLPYLIFANWNLGEYWGIYWGVSAIDILYFTVGFIVIWGLWGAISGFSGGLASGVLMDVIFINMKNGHK